ncbi:MAG: OmpA family protein [Treponema sp.]|nr:OmpA family protein [Treponema sp.]
MIGLFFFLICPLSLSAQSDSGVILGREKTDAYKIIERSDWSRYDNGRYTGLVYREVRATLNPVDTDTGQALLYQGNFYVLEETLRNMQQSARAVNDVIPVRFQIFPNGDLEIEDDRGFPSLRGFPAYPAESIQPGAKWVGRAVRVLDPLNEGYPVTVPIAVEYEYRGIETYRDIPVYRISARYATRFPWVSREDPSGNPVENLSHIYSDERYFKTLQGSHQVDILLQISDGLPLLMRDNLDETFTWSDGRTVRFRGFTLTFGEGYIPLNADQVADQVNDVLNDRDKHQDDNNDDNQDKGWTNDVNITLTPVPGGVRLTVNDIRFIADSDEFLTAEYPRLDKIAEALKKIPDRTFLVEGHTAAVGRPTDEHALSTLRAKRMVDELTKRGIGADRFLYKGWGGTRPLGDNATEEGRALNRRVEITIMD